MSRYRLPQPDLDRKPVFSVVIENALRNGKRRLWADVIDTFPGLVSVESNRQYND
jgi:hypothetical protein